MLTLFERLSFEQLPFYLHLMKHLADRGIPVPGPKADASGEILHTLLRQAGRGGRPPARQPPPRARRRALREAWARCSRACTWPGATTRARSPTCAAWPGGPRRCRSSLPFLSADAARADRGRARVPAAGGGVGRATPRCRAAPIHADLFRDNVMFDTTPRRRAQRLLRLLLRRRRRLLFDIAVCLNDWCIDLDSRPPRRGPRAGLRARLRRSAPAARRRAAAAAGADARRGAALLDLAAVGPAPAARRRAAQRPRPDALRARAARARERARGIPS